MATLRNDDIQIVAHLCDSVRSEADGKVSLIGILPGVIQSPIFPVTMPCGFFISFNPAPSPGTKLKVELRIGESSQFVIDSEVPPVPPEETFDGGLRIVMDRLLPALSGPDTISIWLTIGDDAAVEVAKTQIRNVLQGIEAG